MKHLHTLIGMFLCLSIGITTQAQVRTIDTKKIYVPFKVGEKFGISDEKGTILLAPQFDYIKVEETPNFFTAFNYAADKSFKTTLIINDKILLKDQTYFGYYYHNEVIIAVARAAGKGSGYYSFHPEAMVLYDMSGTKILDETFNFAAVIEDFDKDNTLPQALIQTSNADGTYSFRVYDKASRKITTTFIDKAKDFDFVDLEMVYHTKELTLTYIDAANNGKELKIGLKNNKFVKTFEGSYQAPPKDPYNSYDYDMVAVPMMEEEAAPQVKPTLSETLINKIEIKNDYETYKPKQLSFETKKLDTKYSKMISNGSKKGLLDVRKETPIIEPNYDDLYEASFRGIHANGYVLLNDGIYTLKVYDSYGKESKMKGIYKALPFVSYYNYVFPEVHLIALYSAEGTFLYYANQDGVVYYKAQ